MKIERCTNINQEVLQMRYDMQVMVNVPDQYVLDFSVSELVGRLKLSTALLMFQAGELSTGAASSPELTAMPS